MLSVESDGVEVRAIGGERIWIENRVGVSDDFVGKTVELTVVVAPGTRATDVHEEISDSLGIEPLSSGKFPCKVVAEVTGYNVDDKWPEAKVSYGYPLVELDTGNGRIVLAHEDVPPREGKQPCHEEGTKWKIAAEKLILEGVHLT